MRILLTTLTLFLLVGVSAQDAEEKAIEKRAIEFSSYLMAGQTDMIVAMYTDDAKIFPSDQDILEGEQLANYWNPPATSSWKTTYHKLTPVEIKVWGNEAYDYGYYEGTSSNGEETSDWRGKYVVIWRKVDGQWKIYLDIWNRIKLND